jgi:hypothetical protein
MSQRKVFEIEINGVKRAITDVNELAQSQKELEEKFSKATYGTELNNKAETVFSVTKEEDDRGISKIEAQMLRDLNFEPYAFGINEQGIPEVREDIKYLTKQQKQELKRVTLYSLDESNHLEILRRVYEINTPLSVRQLTPIIKGAVSDYGLTIGDLKAREFIKHYEQTKFLINTEGYDSNGTSKRLFLNPDYM